MWKIWIRMILIIMMMLLIMYEMIIPQRYEIDTPLAICDAQNLSETLCVSLFELKICFDVFGYHINIQ